MRIPDSYSDWREVAACGDWKYLDVERVAEEDLQPLRDILEIAVPLVPADFVGEGALSAPVRARCSDGSERSEGRGYLLHHVKTRRHREAMERVGRALKRPGRWQPVSPIEEEVLRLMYAAFALEAVEHLMDDPADLDPDDRWLAEAIDVAVNVLNQQGIAFSTLEDTFVLFDPETQSFAQVSAPGTSGSGVCSLFDLTDGPAEVRGTRVWLAASVLIHAKEARRILRTPRDYAYSGLEEPGEEDEQDEQDVDFESDMAIARDMDVHANSIARVALQIGLSCGALDAKRVEDLVRDDQQRKRGAAKGGVKRSQENQIRNRKIVDLMRPLIHEGRSKSNAARIVFKKHGLGTSAGANCKVYDRSVGNPRKK